MDENCHITDDFSRNITQQAVMKYLDDYMRNCEMHLPPSNELQCAVACDYVARV